MKLSQEQMERAARRLIAECIAEAGPHDVPAALRAADILADTLPDEELRRLAGCRPRTEEEVYREYVRALSGADHRDRWQMKKTLRTLDCALAHTAEQHAGIRLALADEERRVTLYGIGTVGPLFPAVTETSELFGEPEVGTTSEAALDTAKTPTGRKARGKGKAKGKGGRKRALPKGLRTRRKWMRG